MGTMAADDVVWRSAVECAALIRRKELSPVELTEAVLARIDAVNPRLNAFCLVAHDVARRLARGCGPIALGSDGGGSVRIPAAFCGLVGLKPSYGRVPLGVGFPGWDHVSHVGPLARTVRDAAAVLDVIAGGDDRDRESLPREPGSYVEACAGSIKGLNVTWTPDLGFARVEGEVLELTGDGAAEFRSLGCHVEGGNPGGGDLEEA